MLGHSVADEDDTGGAASCQLLTEIRFFRCLRWLSAWYHQTENLLRKDHQEHSLPCGSDELKKVKASRGQ